MKLFVPSFRKKGCSGLFVASLVTTLLILLVVTSVVVNGIIDKIGLQDICKDNRCLFKDPTLPNDITCLTDTHCSTWIHPCLIGHCSEEGTEKCVYTKAGLSQCFCKEYYGGRTCGHHRGQVEQEHCIACFNNGTCLPQDSGHVCECPEEWDGELCQQRKIVSSKPNASHECIMSSDAKWDLITNYTHWHELARTSISYLPTDGCVTYDFSLDKSSDIIHVNVTSVPLSKFSQQRQGRFSWGMQFQKHGGHFHVNGSQPLLHVSNDDDVIRVGISPIMSNTVALHMCSTDRLYGKQEYITVLSQSDDVKNIDIVLDQLKQQVNMTFIQTAHHLPNC